MLRSHGGCGGRGGITKINDHLTFKGFIILMNYKNHLQGLNSLTLALSVKGRYGNCTPPEVHGYTLRNSF